MTLAVSNPRQIYFSYGQCSIIIATVKRIDLNFLIRRFRSPLGTNALRVEKSRKNVGKMKKKIKPYV